MTIKNTVDSQQFSYLRIFSDESCDSVFCFFPEWSCILLSNLCASFSHIVRISLCVKKFTGPLRGVKSHWWFHHWIGMSSATPRPMCLLWGTTPWPLLSAPPGRWPFHLQSLSLLSNTWFSVSSLRIPQYLFPPGNLPFADALGSHLLNHSNLCCYSEPVNLCETLQFLIGNVSVLFSGV